MKIKYPRTPHLPWSPGVASDDRRLANVDHFEGKNVVVTEKMDGENCNLMNNCIYARSLDSKHHWTRSYAKALQARLSYSIPDGWRVCGENMYAEHSIPYDNLEDYFLCFSVWNENNFCLSWEETESFCDSLGIKTVPVLSVGTFLGGEEQFALENFMSGEGYVVRLADKFHYDDFAKSVAKYVRKNHVQTDTHWMNNPNIKVNKLKCQS